MPIGAEYEDGSIYIIDWVFSKATKKYTVPIVAGKILKHGIQQINFEANNGGHIYKDLVEVHLKGIQKNYPCSMTSTSAPNTMAKLTKIIQCSDDIKDKMIFLEPSKRDEDYKNAMDELTMFVQIGKNEHDDAADGLSQLVLYGLCGRLATVEVFKRPW